MDEHWHIISNAGSTLPKERQLIYFCVIEGTSISTVRPVISDLKYFEGLLYLHPKWKLLWQPVPIPPMPSSMNFIASKKVVHHG